MSSTLAQSPATAIHEIKNLLHVITANAELALMKGGAKQAKEALDVILAVADRARAVVHGADVLPDCEERSVVHAVGLTEVLGEVLRQFWPVMQRHDVVLVEQFSNVPQVEFASDAIQTVFTNLTINAIEAMRPEGGELVVRVFSAGDSVAVSFSDTGCGIREDMAECVFTPFFTTKDRDGRGIGLALCKEIVAAHGGSIGVQSAPGQGTTFTIKLPAPESVRGEVLR